MNWLVKVAAFKTLSALPGGSRLYRFSQEKFTKSLVPTRDRVREKIGVGLRYWSWLTGNNRGEQLLGGTHIDFGSGWHPTIPFLFYSMGCERQLLFDVVPLMDAKLAASTLETFLSIVGDAQWPDRAELRRLPAPPVGADWHAFLRGVGMRYRAPYFDEFKGLENSIDAVTCTQALMHIPREPMRQCFGAIHRALKPGGLFMANVHLKDLYANLSGAVSKYNHLRYSPEAWERWINSSLCSFNRFKSPDYRELLESAGFRILHFEVEGPTAEDLRELDGIPVHPSFRRFTPAELGAKHLFFVAEKP